jgi:glycolate oxidase FAD binding subunit
VSALADAARRESPAGYREAAELLRGAAEDGVPVRPVGGGTKLAWGGDGPAGLDLVTDRLDAFVEHNAGDLTAVLQAGVPLARAQAVFADADQMLALDPPLGHDDAATVGGIVATADSGPLRHRYGGVRDLVIGIAVALSDGVIARSGGRVIKNVAGYDLAKLYTGSLGSLGVVLEVAVRLHPLPRARATVTGGGDRADALASAAAALAHAPLDMEALDVEWRAGAGAVHARFAGKAAGAGAEAGGALLARHGLEVSVADDDALWRRMRDAQRSDDGIVMRVSGRPDDLAGILAAADRAGGAVVARAALGLAWVALPAGDAESGATAVRALRAELAPRACVVTDAPAAVRERVDAWPMTDAGALALMRRVKERFDPAGVCNPAAFGGALR